MRKNLFLLVFGILSLPVLAFQDTISEKKIHDIYKLESAVPVIDGILSEALWEHVSWSSNFTQHLPHSGEAPSFQTRFAMAHDNNFLYGAIECEDSSPDSIDRRMTRRDDINGDFVMIGFDSYHDLRTAFLFAVTAGGVKGDMIMSEDGQNEDETWDPVWWVKTSITDHSWIAEFKIPFSQLRFDNSVDGIWGLNIYRSLFRYNEESFWQHISPDAPGLVHLFGELHGMKDVKPRKLAEVIPYVNAGTKRYEADPENPFMTGKDGILNTGFDAKLGLTNNMTLDLSVNPDFGQVEADPSEVNLSAYETFFQEKRPLFIEGKNIYSFPIRWGGDAQNLFYSRRIGRRPHYYPDLGDDEYARVPDQTNIIAAAKLSGKTRNGTSIGILGSVTAEEFADINCNGQTRKEQVEPLTNYFVGRVLQDLDQGNTIIGGIVTNTYRNITTKNLEFLPTAATTGGIDFQKYWKNRSYHLKFVNYFSHVSGSEESITSLQQSPAHLFQRPDDEWVSVDSTRTSLSGFGGNIQLSKISGRFNFMAAAMWKSPGVDLNDLGYFRMGDEMMQVIWIGYNFFEPFSIFRRLHLEADQFSGWDFGGELALAGYEAGINAFFNNFWSFNMHANLNGPVRYNSYLRGGPSIILPGSMSMHAFIGTDDRKKLVIEPFFRFSSGFLNHESSYATGIEFEYRPANAVNMSVEPVIDKSIESMQYVTQIDQQDQSRYIFASIDQTVLVLSFRANITLNPELTIQYWGQPFIANGNYYDFKYVTNGEAEKWSDRYHTYTADEISFSEENLYTITESGTGLSGYEIENPDFHVKEFLSNLVLRWEYHPGSFLYLVWSQSRNDYIPEAAFSFRKDIPGIWDIHPTNIFLVKLSYRIGR